KPAAVFFAEPKVTAIMLILAATVVIGGFENIGTVDFRRNMDFAREFYFLAGKRFCGFVVTMSVALWSRNYWALLAGVAATRISGVVLSNAMQPFRPRLSLRAVRELFQFSRWTLLSNIITAGLQRGPQFAIGNAVGSRPLGLYVVALDLGMMPSSEVAAPMNRAAIPGYAKLLQDPAVLRATFLDIGSLVAMVAIPAGVGLAAVAEPAVQVLLGSKWLDAVPLIQILALSGVLVACGSNMGSLFIAIGQPLVNSAFLALRLVVLVCALVLLLPRWGVIGAAWAELIAALASFLCSAWVTQQRARIGVRRMLARLWRPLVASAIMFAVVGRALDAAAGASHLVRLLAGVTLGAAVFFVTAALLWWICGRPGGAERMLLNKAREWFRSR
ncbi:MAG: oligosaccharide flippase family protein, partial [Steroidobacteraceae bacterium]|nr:oligosaccharide flippase family protein [Steroidobacteraceae bacterium]